MSRVLITGGASGLGLALATAMLARGDEVLVGDLAEERPDSVPEGAAYVRLNVRSQQDWDAALADVRERWGGLDLLVNNAGVATGGRIDVEAFADWERVIDINLLGVVRGCQTFVPLLKEQGSGRIVNVASLAGLVHGPAMSSALAPALVISRTAVFSISSSFPCSEVCRLVRKKDGQTTLTAIPKGANSNRNVSDSATTPAFAAL